MQKKNTCRKIVPASSYKIATTSAELTEAFHLVYRAYMGRRLIGALPFQLRVTPYHILPSTEVFIGLHDGAVNCTLSLIRDDKLGLPMESICAEEVAQRRNSKIEFAEVSCLANRHGGPENNVARLVGVMSLMAQCAKRRGVDQLLIAIHPRHAPFYRRYLGFCRIGGMKPYDAVRNHPAVPMSLDLSRLAIDNPQSYTRLFGVPFSDEQLAYRPLSNDLRSHFRHYVEAESGRKTLRRAA